MNRTRVVGRKTKSSYPLDPWALVGQGVEGRVYRVGGKCIKVFSSSLSSDHAEKIDALVGLGRSVSGFAWPLELVEEPTTNEPVGFAMDLVPGESLESLLDARATAAIPVLTKVAVALAVARAVANAHAHRGPRITLGDVIKAGNVVIDVGSTSAQFVDAASATLYGFRVPSGAVRDAVSPLTTPGYVPKEVLDNPGALPSHAADLFALAVLVFEILFGKPPYEARPGPASLGLGPDELIRRGFFARWVTDRELEAPSYDPVDLPDDVDELFRAAFLSTAVRPAASRWCSALEGWLDRLTPKPDPAPDPDPAESSRARKAWGLVDRSVGIAILLWLVGYAVHRALELATPEPPPSVTAPPIPTKPVGPPLFQELFE